MQLEQARQFMHAIGSEPKTWADPWLRGPCPFARWTHQKGADKNPSFGLYVKPSERLRFHCFTCMSGDGPKLLQTLTFHRSKNPDEFTADIDAARTLLENEELLVAQLPEYGSKPESAQFHEFPDYWLHSFLPAVTNKVARDYLEYRGFDPDEVAPKYDLRVDLSQNMLVFPYRDVYGRLAGARGRLMDFGKATTSLKHHDYTWEKRNNAALCWYGEEALHQSKPVVIVEGQFDRLRVARVYPHVMANLTAKPVKEKMWKLVHCSSVVLLLDPDVTGHEATKRYSAYLASHGVSHAIVALPQVFGEDGELQKIDPDTVGEEWLKNELADLL